VTADRDTILRIRAHLASKPVLRTKMCPVRIGPPECRMAVAFVRMGGESSPWGVGWKIGGDHAEIRFVPEPRNRASVQEMLRDFAEALEGHFRNPELELPQVILPGPTHTEMLHVLALRHANARSGDPALLQSLSRMGRRCFDLFDAASNRNRTHCLDMTTVLRAMFAFPCEPVREAHLGYLIGWFDPTAPAEGARLAEALPVSTSLDPTFEAQLAEHLDAYHRAKGDPSAAHAPAAAMGELLSESLNHRIGLTCSAIDIALQACTENPGVEQIVQASQRALNAFEEREANRQEGSSPGVPGGKGHPLNDARALAFFEADQVAAQQSLAMHDEEIQCQLIDSGSGIEGNVKAVCEIPNGRSRRMQMDVEAPIGDLMRMRIGDDVTCVTGRASGSQWLITAISETHEHRRITLVSKAKLAAADAPSENSRTIRLCRLEKPELRRRLAGQISKVADAVQDQPLRGRWILDAVMATESAQSQDTPELDLAGTPPAEATDGR
jgi:hypothetical protein